MPMLVFNDITISACTDKNAKKSVKIILILGGEGGGGVSKFRGFGIERALGWEETKYKNTTQ